MNWRELDDGQRPRAWHYRLGRRCTRPEWAATRYYIAGREVDRATYRRWLEGQQQ